MIESCAHRAPNAFNASGLRRGVVVSTILDPIGAAFLCLCLNIQPVWVWHCVTCLLMTTDTVNQKRCKLQCGATTVRFIKDGPRQRVFWDLRYLHDELASRGLLAKRTDWLARFDTCEDLAQVRVSTHTKGSRAACSAPRN